MRSTVRRERRSRSATSSIVRSGLGVSVNDIYTGEFGYELRRRVRHAQSEE
jgi:hypothetical protein